MNTYAGVEGEVGERAVAQQASLVRRHAVTDLVADLRRRALERAEAVQLRDGCRVLNPIEQLFG